MNGDMTNISLVKILNHGQGIFKLILDSWDMLELLSYETSYAILVHNLNMKGSFNFLWPTHLILE